MAVAEARRCVSVAELDVRARFSCWVVVVVPGVVDENEEDEEEERRLGGWRVQPGEMNT